MVKNKKHHTTILILGVYFMNRAEIVRVMQNAVNGLDLGYCSKEKAAQLVDAFIDDVFVKSLSVDQGLTLRGVGTWTVREYPGRTVPHPQGNGEELKIEPYKSVNFKASGNLKGIINGRIEG
jgi:nucleoid DNA-binding protein